MYGAGGCRTTIPMRYGYTTDCSFRWGFWLAVSLGMNTGNPERSVFAVTCGVAATVLLAVLPGIGMAVILNRFVPMIIGAFVQWLIVRK